jgi:uncharacterized protein with ParB-like and HNH nuclease domain
MAKKINEFIKEELILPDIQREFVWDSERICKLFDSILRGYPIGNMLIWKLKGADIIKKEINFYRFLTNYNEYSPENNERLTGREPNTTYYAVLDGQQRTQSLLIGLKGYLKLRKYRGKYDDPKAYKKNYLYINLLGNENKDDDYKYEFKFLTEEEANNDEIKKWFPVYRTIEFSETSDMQEKIVNEFNLVGEEEKKARRVLAELFDKINSKELINWFEISSDKDIDEVLNIFVRTNSGGVVLSKTDLLFSTIVSEWTNAREKVEDLLDEMNNKGGIGARFNFTKDFIMRAILYVLDKPIDMKVQTFKENIKDIEEKWPKIEQALKETTILLKSLNFSKENIISTNAVMPIVYYIYKGGIVEDAEKEEIRKYLVVAQLQKLYGVASNSTLKSVRDELIDKNKNLKNIRFKFENLKDVKITGDRDFKVNKDIVDKWFEYNKGEYTFLILSLLYPCAKIASNEFHQDHMHPESKLKKTKFSKLRNNLANLQLLEGKENESKQAEDLKEWIKKNPQVKFLPEGISLELDNYEKFLEKRKELMANELLKILKI